MKYVSFTEDEKSAMFDEIAKLFYNSNFGQASKAEIELMMFNFYLKKMIDVNRKEDDTIDYNQCSDYKISKDLGITQQRVRNLKVKNNLINPIDFDWKLALSKLTENARYDKATKKITLNIPDPNLYLEIQNFIEEHGAYVEKQLNSKILQIRVEYYIELVISLETDTSRNQIIKSLRKKFKENGNEDFVFDEKNIGKTIIESAVDIISILNCIAEFISPANCIANSLIKFLHPFAT